MNELVMRTHIAMVSAVYRLKHGGEEGQGTTEYAILVGVLAVIAMLAISAFKGIDPLGAPEDGGQFRPTDTF